METRKVNALAKLKEARDRYIEAVYLWEPEAEREATGEDLRAMIRYAEDDIKKALGID